MYQILAAQNQYSSLEKAQEVLHHLAWANGISVDSQDDWMPSEVFIICTCVYFVPLISCS